MKFHLSTNSFYMLYKSKISQIYKTHVSCNIRDKNKVYGKSNFIFINSKIFAISYLFNLFEM